MTRLPTLFLSHGSPMTAVEPGAAGQAWAALARALPVPRAVLMVSAHWDTELPMLSGNAKPETIHDFGGFPDALYALRYPAPGAPDVAQETAAVLKAAGFTAGIDGCRGLDHGAWVPLMHMYPQADVPVVQLSVQTGRGVAHHVHLGAALAPLAERGVLVIGSGHATHNLRDWMTAARSGNVAPMPYVEAFAGWLDERLAANDGDALIDYRERRPEAARAHPTEEHYVPLPVAWAAAGPGAVATRVHRETLGGALAMDAWRFDPPASSGSGRI
jgi:4,5-DOPA dioxygenase extradiol